MLFGQIEEGKAVSGKIGEIIRSCWEEIPLHFPSVEIDGFVVMPNHVHGIILISGVGAACCAPTGALEARSPSSLSAVVRSFKSSCSRCVSRLCLLQGGHLWQRNYYEHIIRNGADLNDVREYILNNPVQWSQDRENPDRA